MGLRIGGGREERAFAHSPMGQRRPGTGYEVQPTPSTHLRRALDCGRRRYRSDVRRKDRASRCAVTTVVRGLTEAEKASLAPLVRELVDHAERCAACQAAPVPATAAELGEANYCPVGAELYRRWLKWLRAA